MGLILFRKEDQEICVDENTVMAEVLTNDNTWEYIGEFEESASDDLDDQAEDSEEEDKEEAEKATVEIYGKEINLPTTKAELREMATALGLTFRVRDTVADLQQLIKEAL